MCHGLQIGKDRPVDRGEQRGENPWKNVLDIVQNY